MRQLSCNLREIGEGEFRVGAINPWIRELIGPGITTMTGERIHASDWLQQDSRKALAKVFLLDRVQDAIAPLPGALFSAHRDTSFVFTPTSQWSLSRSTLSLKKAAPAPAKKSAPKKSAPKKTAPKKAAPAPKKSAPKKTVVRKAAPVKKSSGSAPPRLAPTSPSGMVRIMRIEAHRPGPFRASRRGIIIVAPADAIQQFCR